MRARHSLFIGSLLTFASLPISSPAAYEEWKDNQGNTFKGEPVESIGPLAHFRIRSGTGRMLPWRALSPADCVRFYQQALKQPARADDWAQANSPVSPELAGRVFRLQEDKLVAPEWKGRPEPEFYLLFFANSGVGKSWEMLGKSIEPYWKLLDAYPGQIEGVYFGLQHSVSDHSAMARQMRVPWLITDFHEQRHLSTISNFAPVGDKDAFGLVVVTRHGVPVFSTGNPEAADLTKAFASLKELLELMQLAQPKGWLDRAYYLKAVQPVIHATDRADPVMVGNPLVADGLKQRNITKVDALFEVAADGAVLTVTIKPDTGVPAAMIAPLSDALKKSCIMVPAVDHGQFVPGTYHYHLEVAR